MRTDVKVGLICVFAIILGVVIYFVAQGNAHLQKASGNTAAAGGPTTAPAHSESAVIPALQVAPASAAPMAAAPLGTADSPLRTVASATPTGGVGGGIIVPPADRTTTPAAGTTPPATAPAGNTIITAPPSVGGPIGITRESTPALTGGTPAPGGSRSSLLPGELAAAGGGGYPGSSFPSPGGTGIRPTIQAGSDRSSSDRPSRSGGSGSIGIGDSFGSPASSGGTTSYRIQKGDMLGTIAQKFNVSVKAIEAANPGIDSTRLKIDSTINIPAPSAGGSNSSALTRATAVPASSSTTRPSRGARMPAGGTTAAVSGGNGAIKPGTSYTVKKGDTLASIAQEAYGTRNAWQRIFRANRGDIADPNVVREGTVLRIPN